MKQASIQYIIALIICLCAINRISVAQTDKISIENISVKDGLSNSIVHSIMQDSRRFIWFGTQDGLNRYDGYEFVTFRHTDSIETSIISNKINTLFEDSRNNIWVGTHRGISIFDRRTETFKNYRHSEDITSLSSDYVSSIIEDQNNIVWIGTHEGLNRYDTVNKNFFFFPLPTNDEIPLMIKSLAVTPDNRLWVGSEAGLFIISADRKNVITIDNSDADNEILGSLQVNTLFTDKEGNVYIGTSEGLTFFDHRTNAFTRFTSPDADHPLNNAEISDIVQDQKGFFWIGTFGRGLIRWNGKMNTPNNQATKKDITAYLSENHVNSLYVDESGMLWAGTYDAGVNKIDLTSITFNKITTDNDAFAKLMRNEVYALLNDQHNRLWIGTDEGVSIYDAANEQIVNLQNGNNQLIENSIYCIAQVQKDIFWLGTAGGGIAVVELKNQKPIVKKHITTETVSNELLLSDVILQIYNDSSGNVWVGTDAGLNVLDTAGNIIKSFTSQTSNPSSLSDNNIQSIYKDSEGTIWIGTSNGLNRYRSANQSFTQYHADNQTGGLSSNSIYCIVEDQYQQLWIGTDGGGISCFDANRSKFRNYTTNEGLPDNVIYGALRDNNNCLWLSTNKGLCKITQSSPNDFSIVTYDKNNWLHCNNFNIGAYHKSPDGVLFFGCNEGITYFNPDNVRGNTYVPPIVITDFQLFFEHVLISNDGKSPLSAAISETSRIILTHKQNVLHFEFSALSFIQNKQNQYAFMMEGFDDTWRYVRDKRSATYTNLDPGTYVFRVKASNNNGVWNEEGVAIHIIIQPPFYRQPWFYVTATFIGILLIISFVQYRTHALRQTQKILEQRVKERTEEVMKQQQELQYKTEQLTMANEELNSSNEELQVTLENLKKTQSQLVNAEKMASLGQLTAGVAHEINNPINFINGNITPLQRDIDDIVSLLHLYDQTVKQNNLEKYFADAEKMKQDIDLDYVMSEIKSLMKGIREGVDRTTAIVKGLRNFSRLDEDDMKEADINEGLESTLLILRNKLKNKAEVVKNYGSVPAVLCYPGKLNQVFMNIISNATDAIDEHGTITISTKADKQWIYISIKDDGRGMPEHVKDRIFEPFFTTKDVGKGTGLGLSISFGIIEKHEGRIEVLSQIGKGTEFIIVLPIKK